MTISAKKRILIMSHDKIGANMAGPGIRYHYMAQTLSKHFNVTVGFFDPTYLPDSSFEKLYQVAHVDKGEFRDSFIKNDAVIAMWLGEEMMQFCESNKIFMVFDVYAPVPVENLALFLFNGERVNSQTDYLYRQSYNLYEKFFEYGDLFLFSNRRQLDFWMGYAFGSGIISVSNYKKRPVFDRFICAPMGIDTKLSLERSNPVIKGVLPGISESDKVLLWTGGIWNWFDAQTLIHAMAKLKLKRPDIKLVFFGTKHPNPDVPAMKEASDAKSLAQELNLLNETVFLHEGWVPYHKRIDYLLEADAAVNTTKDTIESEMSHRTRVLDHILCSLPTIATSGDYISDEVIERQGLGIVVPPNDIEALVSAIIEIVDKKTNKSMRAAVSRVRDQHDWTSTLQPLQDSLTNDMIKLLHVATKKPREMPKNKLSYKVAKKILPQPVKKAVVKVFRYGR